MNDSYGDSWTDGGWIEVYGINGNMAFKGMMAEARTETHPISLYAPINKNAEWKYASGAQASGNWKDLNYSDASWTSITLGSTTETATGTPERRSLESLEWLPLTFSSTTSLE